jgi:16S rRNA (cytosine1402-N4)-methyltransferase
MEKTNQIKQFSHQPVMLAEVCEYLNLQKKRNIVDLTLGLGGHAQGILEKLKSQGRLIGFDADKDNLKIAKKNLKSYGEKVIFVHANFSTLKEELRKLKIKSVDAILFDLGLSSVHVDDPEKGFSFLREGPLDMRYDKKQSLTAAEVINTYSGKELTRIFKEYGQEPHARKIAENLVTRRKRRAFKTTLELANFIEKLVKRKGHIHPATRVFQALRIEVNKELEVLQSALEQAVDLLKKGGRIVVIAYHSLEDRIVKKFFLAKTRDFINLPHELTTTNLTPTLKIVTKKPLIPSEDEVKKNPRSRSAKLRVAEKI